MTAWHLANRDRRLFEAAHGGSTRELSTLLAENPALLHAVGPRGATALHVAARYGHAAAVELLLRSGADAAAQDNTGHTGLDKALQLGHYAVAALLPGVSEERYSAPPPAATGAQLDAGASESARMHAEMQTAYREALASVPAEPLVLDAVVRDADEAIVEPTQAVDVAVAAADDAAEVALEDGSGDVALWRPDGSEMHLAEPLDARREVRRTRIARGSPHARASTRDAAPHARPRGTAGRRRGSARHLGRRRRQSPLCAARPHEQRRARDDRPARHV